MIRNRSQLRLARQEIERLKERMSALRKKPLSKSLRELQAASLLRMARQLEEQVQTYEEALRGKVRRQVLEQLLSLSEQNGRPRIGEAMFLLRIARRMTQQQLAKKLRTRREVVARWERDDYTGYTLENLQRIFEALGCRIALNVRVAG
jgi:ribosome-binding protein aMBF1 (putative translation factor)